MNSHVKSALTLVLIAAPFVAGAQSSLTEGFTFPTDTATPANALEASSSFASFNPTMGTLTSISTTLTGQVNFAPLPGVLPLYLVGLELSDGAIATQTCFQSSCSLNLSGTDSYGPSLASVEGAGTSTLFLRDASDSFQTTSVLQGSITFNYTPAPQAAPEIDSASAASGFALLLGCLMVLRGSKQKRIAA